MFKKYNSIKALKTLIKLAAVMLTSPATVAVASSLYPDHPITKVTVSVASLILIEGCLLLGWEMLDQQGKHATMTQRWLYAGLMWVAYLSLFGIALYHNEGGAGFAFRATLGVILLYTSIEAGLLARHSILHDKFQKIKVVAQSGINIVLIETDSLCDLASIASSYCDSGKMWVTIAAASTDP
jgi:hypothetical protein